ncbi:MULTISPECIES: entericidin A/B family lipoprotein [Pararhodobacter]|uniref:Entericidin EcnA/B family protein n=1 Tax=Pararhodobacter aggregans TaxID=404875 RepID=A0A2T7UML7_9RHOB|nr:MULTISPECIES: entericidin A/B family lipoprotein [Pararhodobacter]MCA0207227.1 entericidin A/B family lipoprotein [Pseudomonadota bacterium]PTW99159.1 putative small secreted protein [Pararhodobacter aggregans]PVE45879.1 entericidin EcnA/B family protein [Pararhodobacter aggregans]
MKPLILVLTLAAVTAVAGCETVEGAGRDVQAAGQAVSSTARQVQSDI